MYSMGDGGVAGERESKLATWVAEATGAPIERIFRRPGGGRNEAWDVEFKQQRPKLFLRVDMGGGAPYETYTLRREAEIYDALHKAGIPVPEVIAVHSEIEAVLLGYVEGTAPLAKLPVEQQHSIVDSFVPWIAKMHALDVNTMHLPTLGPVGTIKEHVARELDVWETRLNYHARSTPFLQACLKWLRENNPEVPGRPCLVQGDTGPGNFLHDGSKLTAIVDFELAHIGDPMEDLAWIGTRNAQEPVPDFDRLLALYESESGTKVDAFRLKYHMLFAEWRIGVLDAARPSSRVSAAGDIGAQLIFGGGLHMRLTCEAMAALLDVDLGAWTKFPADESSASGVFDAVLEQMKDIVVPNISDAFASGRAKGISRALKYLREVERFGDRPLQSELHDLSGLLGHTVVDVERGRSDLQKAVIEGRLDAKDLLTYEWNRVCWNHTLVGEAMGVLASRHLPKVAR